MKISTLPVVIFFKIYMYTYIVIFGCAGSLLLLGLFSRYEKRGLLSSCGVRASHCGASLVMENRIQGTLASVAVAQWLH